MTQEYFPLLTTHQDYPEALISSIDQATDRILLETMVLDDSGEMANILDAVARARQRGVSVLIIYDKYTDIGEAIDKTPQQSDRFQARLGQLATDGTDIRRVGKSRLNPFAGRHHAKAVVVDNTSYIGGGVNLTGGSFNTNDYMLQFNNQKISNCLYNKLPGKAEARDRDEVLYSDDTTEILLDAGRPGES
ncbi:MAG: phospholipase D family protein, partial [bacterium]|nr:phospholipase D family protein [bacterium]